jgi:hypothetical protein
VLQGFSGFDLIVWRGLTVMHLKDADAQLPEWVQVDLLIVSNNSVRSWSKISKKVHFGYAIVDSSNSWHAAEQLRAEAGKLGVRMHSVLHEGAFDYEI